MKCLTRLFASSMLICWLGACSREAVEPPVAAATPVETAAEFVARANQELKEISPEIAAANWVRGTYITVDTAIIAAAAGERYAEWHGGMVQQALAYDGQELAPETRRAIEQLKLGTSLPTPGDPEKRKELTLIATELSGIFGAGQYCPDNGECIPGTELERLMKQTRDYDELEKYWTGWRTVAPPMRDKYQRYVELVNEGAAELGYSDLGEMWRAGYDMTPAEFEGETARLWEQVKPLYDQLHCAVRATLSEHYGADKVPQDGPIPAHLLGNMWAQDWSPLYDLMEPYPGVSDFDVDSTLKKNYSPQDMVRSAENFYVSLGMDRLPETFWERSQFTKPRDHDALCHAQAWGLDGGNDLRIKMCIEPTYETLRIIYHELGHIYYYAAYRDQPPLFQAYAHSGFDEAIGDTVTLSMTPDYLQDVGLIDSAEESEQAVINRQMQMALDKLAFLPFSKLIDEWRWGVFSGAIKPEDYNKAWWDLRLKYQGIVPPNERSEADFDPGSKFHVPGNVSYTRYFLARIMQFQFQRALCDIAGHEGDLASCSIFGSKEAGARLNAMMASGSSEPWQDALQKLTGTREMDATAIIDYFAPLMSYLKEQNADRSCGW